MSAQAARRFVEAWNSHSSAAVLATMVPGGTYADPNTPTPIGGAALAGYVDRLVTAFPDLVFDILSMNETGDGRCSFQWRLRGTNLGPFRGLPPTRRTIDLPGGDFVEAEGGLVRTVTCYFDPLAVPAQLGMQVVVQPARSRPLPGLGESVHITSGRREPPAALSVTVLDARDEAQSDVIRQASRSALTGMLSMREFLGATSTRTGLREVTVGAWSNADAPSRMMANGHSPATAALYAGEHVAGAHTGVWVPARLGPYWTRCRGCGTLGSSEAGPRCWCGATLPTGPGFW